MPRLGDKSHFRPLGDPQTAKQGEQKEMKSKTKKKKKEEISRSKKIVEDGAKKRGSTRSQRNSINWREFLQSRSISAKAIQIACAIAEDRPGDFLNERP